MPVEARQGKAILLALPGLANAAKEIAEALKMTMATDSRGGGRVRGG